MPRYTLRQQVPVTIGDETHQIWVRELPYQQFIDINTGVGIPDGGVGIMRALCVAALEEPDGSKSYTDETWRQEPMSAMKALYYAVCRVHGVDLEKIKKADELTEDDIEGNVEPSRISGTNSVSTSAAPSHD